MESWNLIAPPSAEFVDPEDPPPPLVTRRPAESLQVFRPRVAEPTYIQQEFNFNCKKKKKEKKKRGRKQKKKPKS